MHDRVGFILCCIRTVRVCRLRLWLVAMLVYIAEYLYTGNSLSITQYFSHIVGVTRHLSTHSIGGLCNLVSLHRYFATFATTWLTQCRYTGISLRLPQHGSHSIATQVFRYGCHNMAHTVCMLLNTYLNITVLSYVTYSLYAGISLRLQHYGSHSTCVTETPMYA